MKTLIEATVEQLNTGTYITEDSFDDVKDKEAKEKAAIFFQNKEKFTHKHVTDMLNDPHEHHRVKISVIRHSVHKIDNDQIDKIINDPEEHHATISAAQKYKKLNDI